MEHRVTLPPDFYDQTPNASLHATEAVMNTVRTGDLLFATIGRLLRPLGISAAGGLVLAQLRDHGPLSPSELGSRLIVTRATVTGLVDSLERGGFVRRTAHPTDRRSVVVEPTELGLATAQRTRELIHHAEKTWLGVLSEEEKVTLIGLLHRIQESVAQAADEADTAE